jgi:hypothetical protein
MPIHRQQSGKQFHRGTALRNGHQQANKMAI